MPDLNDTTLVSQIVPWVFVSLLAFIGYGTYELSIQQAVISTDLQGVKELIVSMQTNYITRAEAEIKFEVLQNELTRMRDSLRAIALRDGRDVDGPDEQ